MIRQNAKANGFENIITTVNKALSDVNAHSKIKLTYAGDGGASLDMANTHKAFQEVDVVTVDDFLQGERTDFIKMDVEGNEEKVLNGAKKTIKQFKPILALSAYHRPTDKEILPVTVLGIDDQYKLKLLTFDDEIFYCEAR
jgi:FkbM family methyltransferase